MAHDIWKRRIDSVNFCRSKTMIFPTYLKHSTTTGSGMGSHLCSKIQCRPSYFDNMCRSWKVGSTRFDTLIFNLAIWLDSSGLGQEHFCCVIYNTLLSLFSPIQDLDMLSDNLMSLIPHFYLCGPLYGRPVTGSHRLHCRCKNSSGKASIMNCF